MSDQEMPRSSVALANRDAAQAAQVVAMCARLASWRGRTRAR